jgi:hypothetical protein
MEKICLYIILGGCLLSIGISAGGGLIPAPILYVVVGGGLLCIVILTVAFAGVLIVRAMSGYRDDSKHPPAQQGDAWRSYPGCQERPHRPSMPVTPTYRPGELPYRPAVHQGAVYPVHQEQMPPGRMHRPIDHHVDPWPTLEPAEDPRRELPTPERSMIRWTRNR